MHLCVWVGDALEDFLVDVFWVDTCADLAWVEYHVVFAIVGAVVVGFEVETHASKLVPVQVSAIART